MTEAVSSKRGLALLGLASLAAGSGLAAASPASATSGPAVSLSLTSSGTGVVTSPSGDLTVGFNGYEWAYVTVHYTVTAASPDAHVTKVQIGCETPTTVTPDALGSYSGTAKCGFESTYGGTGTFNVTVTGTDDSGQPAQSATHTVTMVMDSQPPVPVTRYYGLTRYGTGIAASRAAFPADGSADAVVLARGDQFADALAGIPLAKAKKGPLLLTEGGTVTTLNPAVEQELTRVLPAGKNHTVYILGGTGALSQPIADHISSLGYTVVRLGGQTRTDTALTIAEDPRALDNPAHVIVARGDDFADALAAGPLAATPFQDSHGSPAAVVLSSGPAASASLDAATADYIKSKLAAPADDGAAEPASLAGRNVVAVGGGAVAALQGAAPASAAAYTAVSGENRYATAQAVAEKGWPAPGAFPTDPTVFRASVLGLVTGSTFPDALTGGALMAQEGGALMLVQPTALTGYEKWLIGPEWFQDVPHAQAIAVFGGTGVIGDQVAKTGVASLLSPYSAVFTSQYEGF